MPLCRCLGVPLARFGRRWAHRAPLGRRSGASLEIWVYCMLAMSLASHRTGQSGGAAHVRARALELRPPTWLALPIHISTALEGSPRGIRGWARDRLERSVALEQNAPDTIPPNHSMRARVAQLQFQQRLAPVSLRRAWQCADLSAVGPRLRLGRRLDTFGTWSMKVFS